jgi:hypothetical protein
MLSIQAPCNWLHRYDLTAAAMALLVASNKLSDKCLKNACLLCWHCCLQIAQPAPLVRLTRVEAACRAPLAAGALEAAAASPKAQ